MTEGKYANIINLRQYRTVRLLRNIMILIVLFLLGMLAGVHLKSSLSHAPKTPIWKIFPLSRP